MLNPNAFEFVPGGVVSKSNTTTASEQDCKEGGDDELGQPITNYEYLPPLIQYNKEYLLGFRQLCDRPPLRIDCIPKSLLKKNRKKSKRTAKYDIPTLMAFRSFYSMSPDLPKFITAKYPGHMGGEKVAQTSEQQQEEAKQATLRLNLLLNKVSMDNFEAVVSESAEIPVTCLTSLHAVVNLILDRAIAEPMFSDVYAQLCDRCSDNLPEFRDGAKTMNFRRILLTRCYESLVSSTGACTEGSQDSQDSWRRQAMLENVVFLGELFRRQLLTENIMHVCIAMMLDADSIPSSDIIEAVCRLIRLVGDLLDGSSPASRRSMDQYFQVLHSISLIDEVPSRLRFLINDTERLRSHGWVQRQRERTTATASPS